jgi:hypothetical protein
MELDPTTGHIEVSDDSRIEQLSEKLIEEMTDRELLEEIAITMRGVRAGLTAMSEHPVLGNLLGGLGNGMRM